MASFPNSVFTQRTLTNVSGVEYDANQQTRIYADDLIKLGDEITAIETELLTRRYFVKIPFSSADILALHTTPKACISAPGAGKCIILEDWVWAFSVGGVAYTGGTNLGLYYTATSTLATGAIGGGYITSASNITQNFVKTTNVVLTTLANVGVSFKTATAVAFINGTGTANLYISYRILTL